MHRKKIFIEVLLSASIAILLIMSEVGLKEIPSLQPIVVKKNAIENKIEKRVNHTSSHISAVLKGLDKTCNKDAFGFALDYLNALPKNERFELLIYSNDRLCFWSSDIDVNYNFTKQGIAKVAKIKSSYYLMFSQDDKVKNLKALAFIHISDEYPYQNKYLINKYDDSFKELTGFSISDKIESYCIPIRPKNVKPFYLIPSNESTILKKGLIQGFIRYMVIFLLVVLILFVANRQFNKRFIGVKLVIVTLLLLIIRVAMLKNSFPGRLQFKIFEPELYAHTWFYPSFGDFIINSIFISVLVIFYFRNLKSLKLPISTLKHKLAASGTLLIVLTFYFIAHFSIGSLINHSTIPLGTSNIFNLNIYSLAAYIAIGLWLIVPLSLNILWLRVYEESENAPAIRWIVEICFLLVAILFVAFDFSKIGLLGLLWCLTVFLLIKWFYFKSLQPFGVKILLIWAAITSIYLTLHVSLNIDQKEISVRKVLAVSLSSERDPLAETILPNIYQTLLTDTYVRNCIRDINTKDIELYDYLRFNYFKDYLNRYDLRATVCVPNSFIVDEQGIKADCNSFFEGMISNYGVIIPSSRFYFLSTQSGFISYLGIISYRFDDEIRNLYIEIDSRPSWEMLGYPELLIESKGKKLQLKEYSWAKYHNGRLVTKSGPYGYRLFEAYDSIHPGVYKMYNENMYSHLAYKSNNQDQIIISRPRQETLSSTASFAYNLLFLLVLLIVFLPILGINFNVQLSSLKYKIGWAMVSVIILSMIFVATATIHYSIKNFETRNQQNLSEKLLSLQFELEHDIPYLNQKTENIQYLNERLITLSNTFYTDINIYDTLGNLLSTSRSEIFDKGLIGKRMNPRAWHELHNLRNPKFIGTESIGKISFLSAYVPIINSKGNPVVYLNLPYFTRQEELRNELYNIIVAIINIFALLALLSISLVVAITSQLTRPLEMIRESMSRVNIKGNNATINYKGTDEVGQLISEYNRMVKELARSAEELAQSQRESAWREMAKQIAHEVKNPLTPMKLSLQHLVKAKKEGLPNWDERFERFAQSLTEQINALTVIANEFSSFANLPSAKPEPINLLSIIKDVITIYSGYKHILIAMHNQLNSDPIILADKDQIIRVFNNLIKNAVQAIERGKTGKIDIVLSDSDNFIKVDVTDNGMGIPPGAISKLFTPNFTTKSGGTGLGLAISREIILNFGGNIRFTSKEKQGTTFTVELPRYEKQE